MMEVLLSLTLGVSVWLIYQGLNEPGDSASAPKADRPNAFSATARLLQDRGSHLSLSAASGLILAGIAQVWPGWWVLTVGAGVLGALAPQLARAHQEARRRERLQQALVETVEQLRDSMRTKVSLVEGLAVLADSGPPVVRPEFARLMRRIPLEGFETAVEEMRVRLAHPLSDMLCRTLVLGERLGSGRVTEVLEQLARSTRSRIRVQEEIRAYQTRTVLSARIIACLPLGLLLVIKRVNPEFLAFYDSLAGQVVLLICVVLLGAGYYTMLWLGRLPEERRVMQ